MNREAKFRAWDVEKKKMGVGMPIAMMAGFLWAKHALGLRLDNFIWLQFTGLKDRNEKEIYEGDLVMYDQKLFKVIWDAPSFKFVTDKSEFNWLTHEYSDTEIVGNIYTHPQLLK